MQTSPPVGYSQSFVTVLRLLDGLRDALGQAADPRLHIGFLSAIREARALQPFAGARRFSQQRAALAQTGAGGGAEGNHSLAGEVVAGDELVDRPRGDAPPDGIADVNGIVIVPVFRG